MAEKMPSVDEWLEMAKRDADAGKVGMYLIHNGVVRKSPRKQVREGVATGQSVQSMDFSYDSAKVDEAIAQAKQMDGIYYVRVWLAEGHLEVGDTIMLVLIGADIRPHAVDALTKLVGTIKTECVQEIEQLS